MLNNCKKAVVTGGAGFIGSHVVDALLEAGSEILALDDYSTGRRENLQEALRRYPTQLQIQVADIVSAEAAQAIEQFKPEVIFHFAAQINVRRSVEDPKHDATVNVLGTANLLEAARRSGVRQFLFSSTGGAIYGEQDYFPADEEHPIRPKCPYGVSKRAGEEYLAYYGRYTGMRTVSLRLANIYGPRQNPKGEAGVVAIFTDRLLAGKSMVVNGSGEQTRDFVYVGDVVDAFLRVAKATSEPGFSVYNVGLGNEVSVNQVAQAFKQIWPAESGNSPSAVCIEYGPSLAGEQLRSVISPEKIAGAFGWQGQVQLEEGLLRTVRSFLSEKSPQC